MNDKITIIYSDLFLDHDTGPNHPERPDRLRACVSALNSCKYSNLIIWKEPRSASVNQLKWIHTEEHIDNVKQVCESGGEYLDADSPVCSASYDIALKSAGAWLDGIDRVLSDNSIFVLSRPPGHHAERNRAMGFCLFSNAALAATYALKQDGINKAAIFDWDVHHGNGTQDIVQSNPNIAYVSIHQFPFYPGTGSQMEKGDYNNVLNIPLPAGSGSVEYRQNFDKEVLPFIHKFEPDILIISAGFDAHRNDPLAGMNLEAEDFAYMTKELLKIKKSLLFGLEGGYDLTALENCTIAVIEQLINV